MVVKFLRENILSRYGCPNEFVNDQGMHFMNDIIKELIEKYKIKHWLTSPYHPKANDQIEKTNRILCKNITKIVQNSMIN